MSERQEEEVMRDAKEIARAAWSEYLSAQYPKTYMQHLTEVAATAQREAWNEAIEAAIRECLALCAPDIFALTREQSIAMKSCAAAIRAIPYPKKPCS